MTTPTPTPLIDKIKITVDGNESELFMAVALRNQLSRLLLASGDSAGLVSLQIDTNLQEAVVLKCVYGRESDGKSLEDLKISTADYDAILQWTTEHVTDFFTQGWLKIIALNEKIEAENPKLLPFLTGSTDFPTKTSSAGSSATSEAA